MVLGGGSASFLPEENRHSVCLRNIREAGVLGPEWTRRIVGGGEVGEVRWGLNHVKLSGPFYGFFFFFCCNSE